MKVAVISDEYPRPGFIYGDVFVRTRVFEYVRLGLDVYVTGYQPNLDLDFRFRQESANVFITMSIQLFQDQLIASRPDVILVHFLNRVHMNFLLSLNLPIIIFVHGFEATLWTRKLSNFNSIGALPYLVRYMQRNMVQQKAFKKFVRSANTRTNIEFVFVSNWIWKAVIQDLGISIKRSSVIPNGIDQTRFKYVQKKASDRMKILLIRSFHGRSYGNDLATDAIALLGKKSFFNDLAFSIYGEGYWYTVLTDPLRHFSNVKLHNRFIENHLIPEVHAEHGIFLCPSRWDTQGVSMCEAMASGLVPITTPVGGIPEYTTDQVSCFHVKSPRQIADKVEYLYHNPQAFLDMSRQAAIEIDQKCKLVNTVMSEIQLMKDLLSK